MSGISTVCFASSYAVALLLELSRLVLRSSVRGVLTLGFAGAGFLAHTLYLGYRATTASTIPLSSAYDWYLVAAWALAAVYLYLAVFHATVANGIFILPLVLALIAAAQLVDRDSFAQSPAAQIWGAIHGTFWLLGAVAVMVGFVAGLMYLVQSYRLKHKLPPLRGLRLPSLEWLERLSTRAIVVSVLMTGVGFLSGIVLNLVNHRFRQDDLPWSDPIVWRSGGMVAWLLVAALFNALYKPARRGRKVAYLTVASFVFLAIFLAVQLFNQTEHGGKARGGAANMAPIRFKLDSWGPRA
jgi:ABC-type uncharacterized transport system permease subunit